VSSSPIQQAKARLPLPLLMEQLDVAEHAKKNARCPFHDDTNPSFSVFQIGNSWFFKCHAGCGEGDEINFLEKHKGISRSDATKLYLEMAGCAPSTQSFWEKQGNQESQAFDWLHCVNALTDEHLEQLGNERSYSRAFCSWMRENKLVGLFKSCIAFSVHNNGTIVSTHYRLKDGSWRYHPQGTKTAPFILGDLTHAKEIHVFESQWDMLAFADRTSNYEARSVASWLPEGLLTPRCSKTGCRKALRSLLGHRMIRLERNGSVICVH
jgi:CHC2 zinc finger